MASYSSGLTPGRNEHLQIESTDRESGARLLKLSGPLTLRTLFDFQEASRQSPTAPVIIDLAAVPYMDSAGLGSLIGFYASCHRTGRGFAIVHIPDRVKVLFEMTGVADMLPAFTSIEEAEAVVAPPTQ